MPTLTARLTPRERDCLQLFGSGLTVREISERLGTAGISSVNTYLHNACVKLGAASRRDAFEILKVRTESPIQPWAEDRRPQPTPSLAGPPILEGATLQARILEAISARGEACLLAPQDLPEVGEKGSVENGLRRLVNHEQMIKVERGLYARPLPALADLRRARLDDLMRQLGDRRRDLLTPDGAASAYALGLTSRPPVKPVYLTTKEERQFDVGRLRVILTEADPWWFEGGHAPAGAVVRALGWAGSERVAEAWTLIRPGLDADTTEQIRSLRTRLPVWLVRALETG